MNLYCLTLWQIAILLYSSKGHVITSSPDRSGAVRRYVFDLKGDYLHVDRRSCIQLIELRLLGKRSNGIYKHHRITALGIAHIAQYQQIA